MKVKTTRPFLHHRNVRLGYSEIRVYVGNKKIRFSAECSRSTLFASNIFPEVTFVTLLF